MSWLNNKLNEAVSSAKKLTDEAVKRTQNAIETLPDIETLKEKGADAISSLQDIEINEVISGAKESAATAGDYVARGARAISGVDAYRSRQNAKKAKEEAEDILARTRKRMDEVRLLANSRLETFGTAKCEMLQSTVGRFIAIVKRLNNSVKVKEYDLAGCLNIKEKELEELETVEMNASTALKTAAIGGSMAAVAATGVPAAVTGAVSAMCAASTGTAISSLSGAAATNATLAWLGGGSIASGGGGVAAGTAVLGGLTFAATGIFALASMSIVATSFYSKKYTEAVKFLEDVKIWEAKALMGADMMTQVVKRSDELLSVTARLEARTIPVLDKLDDIADQFSTDNEEHLKTFQSAAILVKSMSELAQTPLIDDNGELSGESNLVMESTKKILNTRL